MASFLLPLGLGAASFLGGLFKHHQQQKTTTTGTSTTTPTFDPAFGGLKSKLIDSAMRNLSGGGGYSMARNVTNQNLQSINAGANAAQTGLAAKLAAMGIRGSAAAAPMANLDLARFGAGVNATNQEPLLAHSFDLENLDRAFQVLGLGRGSTTTSTGTAIGDLSGGGGLGGGFDSLGAMLGFLYANGMLGPQQKSGSSPGGGGSIPGGMF